MSRTEPRAWRVGVLGDVHGDHKRPALDLFVREAQPDILLSVGDLQDYQPYPVSLIFIRGNHEDWPTIAALESGTLVVPNLQYLSDDSLYHLGDLSVLGVGGNWSPTGKMHPRYIRPAYLERLRNRRADIVLSHETPLRFAERSGLTLEPLRDLCLRMAPRLWFSGHHHHWEVETIGRTTAISLGKWPHEWAILDIAGTSVTWQRFAPALLAEYEAQMVAWRAAEEIQKHELLSQERREKRR